MSFYRKYRPQTLTELVGQAHVRQTFVNALARHQLNHAYLFTGPRGTGKTSTARIIARAINCEQPAAAGEPCNTCRTCVDALENRLVDLIEIDAASNRGIDEIRDLKEKIQFAPSSAKAKIYIIDEVHMLTKEAFNALLKTLEEPPAHAYFILATTEAHKVPETILSRCQRFDFHRIELGELVKHLQLVADKEGITTDEAALTLIARQAAGGLRDALGLLEQLGSGGSISVGSVAASLGLTRPAAVADFVQAILAGESTPALASIEQLLAEGVNLHQFTKAVIGDLREKMLVEVAANRIAAAKGLIELIEIFERAALGLKNAIIPQLPLEIAAIEALGRDTAPSRPAVARSSERPSTTPAPAATQPTPATQAQQVTTQPTAKTQSTAKSPSIDEATQATKPSASEAKTNSIQLTLDSAQTNLTKAVAALGNAGTRLALQQASVINVNGSEIVLGLASDFYLEKLDRAEIKLELAQKFSELLGQPVAVAFARAELELAEAAPTMSTSPKVAKSANTPTQPAQKINLAEAAEKLFADESDGF